MATYLKTGTGAADFEEVDAINSSAGAGDSGKIVQLDAAGKLDSTFMPTGFGSETISIVASEALSAGDFVNVFDDAGTPKMRKADAATAGKEANGFVLSSVTSGNSGTCYFEGTNTSLSTLTVGSVYYLDTTAGGVTTTRPSATGNVIQRLGRAHSTTAISFTQGSPLILVA